MNKLFVIFGRFLNFIRYFAGNVPRVTNITCDKRQPCERAQITTWEQRHNVYLSDDMRRFYLSTDGFILSWSYQYSREYFSIL